jgi:predicted 3-demethylubiquinone-9 3-methyltransferase (glyoxalase superfamily)
LWFNQNAEAVKFYLSIFKNSKLLAITRYSDAGPGPKGSLMTATLRIEGQDSVALNTGPIFQFNEAISLS